MGEELIAPPGPGYRLACHCYNSSARGTKENSTLVTGGASFPARLVIEIIIFVHKVDGFSENTPQSSRCAIHFVDILNPHLLYGKQVSFLHSLDCGRLPAVARGVGGPHERQHVCHSKDQGISIFITLRTTVYPFISGGGRSRI
jgi:hypothetical protein